MTTRNFHFLFSLEYFSWNFTISRTQSSRFIFNVYINSIFHIQKPRIIDFSSIETIKTNEWKRKIKKENAKDDEIESKVKVWAERKHVLVDKCVTDRFLSFSNLLQHHIGSWCHRLCFTVELQLIWFYDFSASFTYFSSFLQRLIVA